jgi:ABC-2 family transporter
MIWLTWRQLRGQAVTAGVALLAAAIALAVTGPQLAGLYDSSGLASCATRCGAQASTFINNVKGSSAELIFYGGVVLLYAIPAVIGVFWGAPLVTRELETGTFRLAWNQSVTRARWIAVKLGLVGLATMITAGLLSLMISWWASPLYAAAEKTGQNSLSISRLSPPLFGATGIAPIGYAAFAFALGVTAGVLVRRTVPAMAITLVVFAAIQIFWPTVVRQHLISPVSSTVPLTSVSFDGTGITDNNHFVLYVGSYGAAGSWVLGGGPVTPDGAPAVIDPAACIPLNFPITCLARHGIRLRVTYQPASRYWDLQWLETGIFLVLGGGLGGVCYWRLRRLT